MNNIKRSVVIVEDDDFLRSLLADGLRSAGFSVNTAGDAQEARQVIASIDPDAMLIDIDLGAGANGIDLGESLAVHSPDIAVVYLTALADPRLAGTRTRALNPKVAYLNKRSVLNIETVIEALEVVLRDRDVSLVRHDLQDSSVISRLSNTQLEVLRLMAEGLTNQQIALGRNRSLSATEALISRIFAVLSIDAGKEANPRIAAVRAYLDQGGVTHRE
jgi:DNA-binding NarL/FixJ family response regulator